MNSPMLIVNRGPIDVASDNDQPDESAEAGGGEGSGESGESGDDEDDSDDGDEAESSRSEERVPESRSKVRQDPGVRGGGPKASSATKPSGTALPTSRSKRGCGELALSPEKVSKQAKITTSNPRKAVFVPKIKMSIPIASA